MIDRKTSHAMSAASESRGASAAGESRGASAAGEVAYARVGPSERPPFRPHPWIRGGHAQTLAGVYLRWAPHVERARRHVIALPDGDRVVVHDDNPPDWNPGQRAVLLLHGLSGSHASGYMRRASVKFAARGVRSFRLDLRGCGAGAGLAILPYHSGRSEDAARVLEWIAAECPGSPVTLIGYSLGGNITLKLLGELGDATCFGLDSAVAVCPPIDLEICSRNIGQGSNRMYDRHFVRSLSRGLAWLKQRRPEAPGIPLARRARTLHEFDDLYTAPVSGFGSAANYYRLASSKPLLGAIRKPTLLIAADDDPLIPRDIFNDLPPRDFLELLIAPGGGHLGFIGRAGSDGDRRWLDWRIVDWVLGLSGP